MRRKGFVSVIALLVMTLILVSCAFTFYLVTLQSHIVTNSQKNIQSRIINDENINRLIYDTNNLEKIFIPEIYEIIRKRTPPYINIGSSGIPEGKRISIDNGDNLSENIKSVRMRLQGSEKTIRMTDVPDNFDETTNFILDIESEYEGINNIVVVMGTVINKIFEIEEPFINESKMIDFNLVDKFNELISLVEEEIFNYDPKGTSSFSLVNIKADGFINESYITETLDNINRTYEHRAKTLSLNIISEDTIRPQIEIKLDRASYQKVVIRGNIYCEGDLIISSPFELDGNLILNGGNVIVNSETKPIVKGKLIYSGSDILDVSNINFQTKKRSIYLYGSYLPGFLDINIDVIKNK